MLSLVLATAVASLSATALGKECTVSNWNDLAANVSDFNDYVLGEGFGSVYVDWLLESLDPIEKEDVVLDTFSSSFLGYDYDYDITLKELNVTNFNSINISDVIPKSSKALEIGAYLAKDEILEVDTDVELKITQTTITGCKEDEEQWGLYCYKKCSILTNGAYPRRKGSRLCAHESKWWKFKLSGWFCDGFNVGADGSCPDLYHKLCFTDDLFSGKDCDPRVIKFKARIAIEEPSFKLENNLVVDICTDETTQQATDTLFVNLMYGDYEAAFAPVKEFNVNSIDIDFDRIEELDLEIEGASHFKDKFYDFVVGKIKYFINKDGLISKFVMKKIEKTAAVQLNNLIDNTVRQYFGGN